MTILLKEKFRIISKFNTNRKFFIPSIKKIYIITKKKNPFIIKNYPYSLFFFSWINYPYSQLVMRMFNCNTNKRALYMIVLMRGYFRLFNSLSWLLLFQTWKLSTKPKCERTQLQKIPFRVTIKWPAKTITSVTYLNIIGPRRQTACSLWVMTGLPS